MKRVLQPPVPAFLSSAVNSKMWRTGVVPILFSDCEKYTKEHSCSEARVRQNSRRSTILMNVDPPTTIIYIINRCHPMTLSKDMLICVSV